jgi:hypothetical protein
MDIQREKHPLENAEYSPGTFVQLLINAAQAKDYVETISSLDQGLPNVDTLFWQLSECASRDLILREYKKVVKRNIEAVKGQIRRRRFIIAIDETHEPFYWRITNILNPRLQSSHPGTYIGTTPKLCNIPLSHFTNQIHMLLRVVILFKLFYFLIFRK